MADTPPDATIQLPEVVVHPEDNTEQQSAMTAGVGGTQPGVSLVHGGALAAATKRATPEPISPELRSTYASALLGGTTLGPTHFQDAWNLTHQAVGQSAAIQFRQRDDIAPQLPSQESAIDHTLAILHDNSLPPDLALIETTKANLLDHWAETGLSLPAIYSQALADPSFSDSLTRAPPAPPEPPELPSPSPSLFDPLKEGMQALGEAAAASAEEHKGQTLTEMALNPTELAKAQDIAMGFGPGTIAAVGTSLRGLFETAAQRAVREESEAAGVKAQATIRETRGQAERATQVASAALEKFRSAVNKHLPDFQRWLRTGADSANMPVLMHLINHIEGHPSATFDPASPLLKVANTLRGIVKDVRGRIEAELPDHHGFYEDYYRHLWEQPSMADRVFGRQRGGSSASLKEREIPTLLEGIQRGLIPRILDPIENTLHYATGMRNYLAQHEVFRLGKESGLIQLSDRGPPSEGWLPLRGRFAELPGETAYAPKGYANAFNSWVGRGFHEWPGAGRIYDKLAYAANASVAMKLALSGYHAWNIAQEAVIAGLTDSIGRLARGQIASGLKEMGYSLTVAPQLGRQYLRGRALQQQYMRTADHSAADAELADLFAKAGGRAIGRGQEYMIGNASNWFQAWRRGSLAMELKTGAAHILDLEDTAAGLKVPVATGRTAAYFAHELGRVLNTAMAPLFDGVIPKVKMAAWADEMESWLRANPLASDAQKVAQGRKLVDSMDDRFGEMVQDNLFWPRALKQSLNAATVSVGWEYGTLRAFGGAAKDLLSGNVLSTRARWLLTFPVVMALQSAAYQYLKTGTTPFQTGTPVKDLIVPRTGGATPEGAPERALLPGYQKDPMQWYWETTKGPANRQGGAITALQGIAHIAEHKLNPFVGTVEGLVGGHDWLGNDIRSRLHPEPPPGWEGFVKGTLAEMGDYGKFLTGQINPIMFATPRLGGSALTEPERAMGLRPAPEWLQNPERVRGGMIAHEKMERGFEQGRQRKANERLLEPNPDIPEPAPARRSKKAAP